MKSSELLALADRCENAVEPDRNLDAEICRAVGMAGGNPIVAAGVDGWLVGSDTNPNPVKAPAFTLSLDAAVSLVPAGFEWLIVSDDVATVFYRDERMRIRKQTTASSDVPALALTAAALRQIAARAGDA